MVYRILIVDDNELSVRPLSKILHSLGYEISVAHSGLKAFEKINREKPKVVLLDIGMPGMDGYEIAKSIRENSDFPEVVLVALTGRSRDVDKVKAREAGFDHYLTKPASIDDIRRILNVYDF